jgi:hypothetical protein
MRSVCPPSTARVSRSGADGPTGTSIASAPHGAISAVAGRSSWILGPVLGRPSWPVGAGAGRTVGRRAPLPHIRGRERPLTQDMGRPQQGVARQLHKD